jgi:hypothetical protein
MTVYWAINDCLEPKLFEVRSGRWGFNKLFKLSSWLIPIKKFASDFPMDMFLT